MNASAKELFYKVLRDNGCSVTWPRRLVFEALRGKEPLSMRALMLSLDNRIDRASLYRAISLFERLDIVQRVYVGWKYQLELSDIFEHHHHHISCLGCGKLVAIKEDTQVEHLIQSLAAKNGMSAERHQLEIQGYCEKCRKSDS